MYQFLIIAYLFTLVISTECPILAGSPDGRVTDGKGNAGQIEIKKCPLQQACITHTSCLEINSNTEKIQLKRKHNYYYQCQGLMYVTNSDWIDFVVRTEQPLHTDRTSY